MTGGWPLPATVAALKRAASGATLQVSGALMIRILVVDDRAEVRLGLEMRLSAEPDMTVAGTVPDGPSALPLIEALSPDVVLMDVEMPLCDGIETCVALHQRYPDLPVVFLTIYDDACTRARAAHAHAAGFVSKDRSVDSLLAAIRQAACAASDGTGTQPQSGA